MGCYLYSLWVDFWAVLVGRFCCLIACQCGFGVGLKWEGVDRSLRKGRGGWVSTRVVVSTEYSINILGAIGHVLLST